MGDLPLGWVAFYLATGTLIGTSARYILRTVDHLIRLEDHAVVNAMAAAANDYAAEHGDIELQSRLLAAKRDAEREYAAAIEELRWPSRWLVRWRS